MPKINLNQIRTGRNQVDRLVSAAGAIATNPQAGLSIAKNLINSGALGGEGISDPSTSGRRSSSGNTRGQKSAKKADIMYPHDLDDQHYMTFRVVRTTRKNLASTSKNLKQRSFILPIPGNLVANYAADYENAEMGLLGGLASGQIKMNDIEKAGQSAKAAISQIGSDVAKSLGNLKATEGQKEVGLAAGIVGGATLAGASVGGLLGAGAGALGLASVGKGLGKRAGLAANPHMAVLFKGITFKEHSFNYKFIPRDQKESEDIQELCREFRFHMLPAYELGGFAYTYPDEFQIIFSEHLSPYLFSIGNCVLKSFNVTFNGSGVPSFSKSGAPMEIDISMGFQETNIETRSTEPSKSNNLNLIASGFGGGKDNRESIKQAPQLTNTVPVFGGGGAGEGV